MKIRQFPDPVLRTPTKRVFLYDHDLKNLARAMLETMIKAKGVGIAAPQLGISLKMAIVWSGLPGEVPIVICNPEILSQEGSQTAPEGCLSLIGESYEVTRPQKITCRFNDLRGRLQILEATGFLATVVMHEFDHLNSKLICDH